MKNIDGSVCSIGHRRCLEKLVHELAKGKAMEKILRV
ncbi:MAG: DUF2200 family protein [Candidatus Kapaibacteriota bacterium]